MYMNAPEILSPVIYSVVFVSLFFVKYMCMCVYWRDEFIYFTTVVKDAAPTRRQIENMDYTRCSFGYVHAHASCSRVEIDTKIQCLSFTIKWAKTFTIKNTLSAMRRHDTTQLVPVVIENNWHPADQHVGNYTAGVAINCSSRLDTCSVEV